jgi:hypothetical protein
MTAESAADIRGTMRYEPIGGWKHGVPSSTAFALQVFEESDDMSHMDPEYYVPAHGFLAVPILQLPHGHTISRLYAKGVSQYASCAIASGIEAMTAPPAYTGCEACADVAHMSGFMTRIANAHPSMVDLMKFSLFTVFKNAVVKELGLPQEIANRNDYRSGMPLPASVVVWAQQNLTPEMIAHLTSKGMM